MVGHQELRGNAEQIDLELFGYVEHDRVERHLESRDLRGVVALVGWHGVAVLVALVEEPQALGDHRVHVAAAEAEVVGAALVEASHPVEQIGRDDGDVEPPAVHAAVVRHVDVAGEHAHAVVAGHRQDAAAQVIEETLGARRVVRRDRQLVRFEGGDMT